MTNPKVPRPPVGATKISTSKVPVCPECGYRIDEMGGCNYDCSQDDLEIHERPKRVIWAKWKREDEFLGDD